LTAPRRSSEYKRCNISSRRSLCRADVKSFIGAWPGASRAISAVGSAVPFCGAVKRGAVGVEVSGRFGGLRGSEEKTELASMGWGRRVETRGSLSVGGEVRRISGTVKNGGGGFVGVVGMLKSRDEVGAPDVRSAAV
jgi:hypothetical protein